jgi:hypothetical protein
MYTGPKTINNGLVYGYDTGYGVADNHTATRFYPGEPTINQISDTPSNQGGWTGSYSLLDSATKSFQFNISNFAANPGAGWRTFSWDMTSNAGSAVTISATIEVPDDSPGDLAWVMAGQLNTYTNNQGGGGYMGYSPASDRYQKSTKNTERISWSGTVGSGGSANQPNGHIGFTVWYNQGIPGTNSYIKVKDVQIELKSHATPFVNGTRGGEGANTLMNLSNKAGLDLSNLSFNATAQPTFDGTDDHIDTGLTRGDLGDSFTLIAYYKFTGSTSRTYTPIFGGNESTTEFFIGKNTGNTNIGVQDGNYNGSFVTGSNAWDGNYHQIVYTYNNSEGKIYLDGVLKSTGSFTKCNTAESIRVGHESEGGGYRFIGDIPRVCVFDRVLTAEEILKDFNAYKNRFNI